MVDVTAKEPSHRRAVARCRVYMEAETASKIATGAITKGDVLAVARVAGIQAAKQTPHLLPLCHPLLVGSVLVNFRLEDTYVEVEANVDTVDRTGVEMEAMTAAAVAALTIYDMCKSIDRSMTIGDLSLWEKTGGRSGTWRRQSRRNRSVRFLNARFRPWCALFLLAGQRSRRASCGLSVRVFATVRDLARLVRRYPPLGWSSVVTVRRQTKVGREVLTLVVLVILGSALGGGVRCRPCCDLASAGERLDRRLQLQLDVLGRTNGHPISCTSAACPAGYWNPGGRWFPRCKPRPHNARRSAGSSCAAVSHRSRWPERCSWSSVTLVHRLRRCRFWCDLSGVAYLGLWALSSTGAGGAGRRVRSCPTRVDAAPVLVVPA